MPQRSCPSKPLFLMPRPRAPGALLKGAIARVGTCQKQVVGKSGREKSDVMSKFIRKLR